MLHSNAFSHEVKPLAVDFTPLRIFPVKERGDLKAPYISEWQDRATCDRATVEAWALKWPSAAVAMPCNAPLPDEGRTPIVLDLDVPGPTHKNGANGLEYIPQDQLLRWTPIVAGTASCGLHGYFRGDPSIHSRKLAPGVELKASGYVLLPPSRLFLPDSRTLEYRWISGELPHDFGRLPPVPPDLRRPLFERDPREMRDESRIVDLLKETPAAYEYEKKRFEWALWVLPEDYYDDYQWWVRIGLICHWEFDGNADGFEIWDEWSAQSGYYNARSGGKVQTTSGKWHGLRSRGEVTKATVYEAAHRANPDSARAFFFFALNNGLDDAAADEMARLVFDDKRGLDNDAYLKFWEEYERENGTSLG